MPRSPKIGIDAHIPSRNNPRRYANGAAPQDPPYYIQLDVFDFAGYVYKNVICAHLASVPHTRRRQERVPEGVESLIVYTTVGSFECDLGVRYPNRPLDTKPGLPPPTPHVKYIPGGHPHLPQTTTTTTTSNAAMGRLIGSCDI